MAKKVTKIAQYRQILKIMKNIDNYSVEKVPNMRFLYQNRRIIGDFWRFLALLAILAILALFGDFRHFFRFLPPLQIPSKLKIKNKIASSNYNNFPYVIDSPDN
jgi:hypothetical protein